MSKTSPSESNDEFTPEGGRRRHHRGPRGRGPGFGPGPWGGRGPWGPPRGPRRERGDVRAAILLLLAEQPRHGYELITEIADRSEGRWQASPGSIYPVLKRLAKDGLVRPEHENGKRIFSLTDEGRAVVAAESEEWGQPWLRPEDEASAASDEMWTEFRALAMAAKQIDEMNNPAHVEAAAAALTEARRTIYGLLAQ